MTTIINKVKSHLEQNSDQKYLVATVLFKTTTSSSSTTLDPKISPLIIFQLNF
jgi:hypothetical protein